MKKFVFSLVFAVILIWALLYLAGQYKSVTQLAVDNAYIRAVVPGQNTTAAFLTFSNRGELDCALLSAESAIAERIEFHTHQHRQNMVKMRPVGRVEVPAGTTVSFEPGGLHLMFFGVEQSFDHNEAVQISIHTDRCGLVSFSALVKDMVTEPMEGMHH